MPFSRKDAKRPTPDHIVAAEDAQWLAGRAVSDIGDALGVGWYTMNGDAADRAALTLCRLRRARAGQGGGPEAGDEAVRAALAEVPPEALLWIASRAVSYMDENGFPEAVEPWFGEDEGPIDGA